jgi:hypothetical protein
MIKKLYGIFAGIAATAISAGALAEDTPVDPLDIPQVTATPSKNTAANKDVSSSDEELMLRGGQGNSGDYQNDVLSNPMITDIGRASSLTGGGGNTAIIVQKGNSNRSSVTQSGNNNYASHSQTGNSNDITVNQSGEDNESVEDQNGDNNHKVITQNGQTEETTNGKKNEGDKE